MQVEDFFLGFRKFGEEGGFKPGLERVRYLLDRLGGPEEELNIIHVGGTNGKGSTISFLRSIYSAAGYSTGTYISPPLNNFRERITFRGRPAGEKELARVVDRLKPAVKGINPSFFEVVTVAALTYFQEVAPDVVLLEVGLGGRLDATNAVQKPLASIITGIDLDHTSILGDTPAAIAREKAGIIKKGIPVISGVEQEEAKRVIRERVHALQAKLIEIDKNCYYEIIASSLGKQRLWLESDFFSGVVNCGLAGKHQARNAALALVTAGELRERFPLSPGELKQGFASVNWPGRMEVVSYSPVILLDGAHNPRAADFLCHHIKSNLSPEKSIKIITGIFRDKDISGIISALAGLGGEHELEFILTASSSPRAAIPEEIGEVCRKRGLKYRIINDLQAAVLETVNTCREEEIIIITGSLNTVGEARTLLKTKDIFQA